MDKVKIQEIADEAGLSNGDLLDNANELGFNVKAANSTISMEEAGILVDYAISGTLPKNWKKIQNTKSNISRKSSIGIIYKSPKKTKWAGITIVGKKVKADVTETTKACNQQKKPKSKKVSPKSTLKDSKKMDGLIIVEKLCLTRDGYKSLLSKYTNENGSIEKIDDKSARNDYNPSTIVDRKYTFQRDGVKILAHITGSSSRSHETYFIEVREYQESNLNNSLNSMENEDIYIDNPISEILPKNYKINEKKEQNNKRNHNNSSPTKIEWKGITVIEKKSETTNTIETKNTSKKLLQKYKIEKKPVKSKSVKELLDFFENSRLLEIKTNEMKKLLRSKGIESVWHFTDRSNLPSILEHGILSLKRIEQSNINLSLPGADMLSHNLDSFKGLDKYVHLSFLKDHPMYHVAKRRKSIVDPIWIEIDISVLFEEKTLFCDKVANDSTAELFKLKKIKKKINFDKMYHHDFDIMKEERKAEILVKGKISPDKILGVYNGK